LNTVPNCEPAEVLGNIILLFNERFPVLWLSVRKVFVVSLIINCPPVPSLPFISWEYVAFEIKIRIIDKNAIEFNKESDLKSFIDFNPHRINL
jgi:hypothetical protein